MTLPSVTRVNIFRSVSVIALAFCGVILGVESPASLVCVSVALLLAVYAVAHQPRNLNIATVFTVGAMAFQLTWMHGHHSLQLLAALIVRLEQESSYEGYSDDLATWSDMAW